MAKEVFHLKDIIPLVTFADMFPTEEILEYQGTNSDIVYYGIGQQGTAENVSNGWWVGKYKTSNQYVTRKRWSSTKIAWTARTAQTWGF